VLFAILVTTIGLFGALALLPVASAQARKGRLLDAVAVAATTCVHEFDARGMRRPQNWIGWDSTGTPQFRLVPNITSVPYGTSFCIDPRFVAANSGAANAASIFPYTPRVTTTDPRMFRITLDNGAGTWMRQLQADAIFFVNDDLTYQRDDDRSIAPRQDYEFLTAAPTVRSRRQTDGHMSWMATLVPRLDRYTLSFNDTYVLSIVMFYDRPTSFGYDPAAAAFNLPDERLLTVAAMPGIGIGGGEVLLTSNSATAKDDLKLRSNDWIMLSGIVQHQVPLPGPQPRWIPVFKWYRVTDTEAEATDDDGDGTWERYVTLSGPDWDVIPANTQAVVVEGVVGVYEKTIRLE
jgi:hypothetical protein